MTRTRIIPNGLSQGSSLAPLLWNAYICDLPEIITQSRCSLFADDTAVWCTGKTYEDCRTRLQEDVGTIDDYCKTHSIKINPERTVLLPMGYKPWTAEEQELVVNDTTVQASRSAKFLGVTIDSRLSFVSQAEAVVRRIQKRNRILAYLAGSSWGADTTTLHATRIAIVESAASFRAET